MSVLYIFTNTLHGTINSVAWAELFHLW